MFTEENRIVVVLYKPIGGEKKKKIDLSTVPFEFHENSIDNSNRNNNTIVLY